MRTEVWVEELSLLLRNVFFAEEMIKLMRGHKRRYSISEDTSKMRETHGAQIGMIDQYIEALIIELLSFDRVPQCYYLLYQTLKKYKDPGMAIRNWILAKTINKSINNATNKHAQYRAESHQDKANNILRKTCKTKEFRYNFICELLPDETYTEIHKHIIKTFGFESATLRKYKERRIQKTKDFRETSPITRHDMQKIEKILRDNNFRLPKDELQKKCGFDSNKFDCAVKKLKQQGRLGNSNEKIDGEIRDVLVLMSNDVTRH